MSGIIVSVHDVAPATAEASRRWVADLDDMGVPATLLVIPGPFRGRSLAQDGGLVGWLKSCADAGHEVAQHGWEHRGVDDGANPARLVTGRPVVRGAAEFWSLDEREARRRLLMGRASMVAAGFRPEGFTPPGSLASAGTLRALSDLGFRYTTSYVGVVDLVTGITHRVPTLSRRQGIAGERLGDWLMRVVADRRARNDQTVRVGLHPADLDQPGLRDVTLAVIQGALARGVEPRTYRDLMHAA